MRQSRTSGSAGSGEEQSRRLPNNSHQKPKSQYLTLNSGIKLHYTTMGEGFPVLFLQGSGPGASGWLNFRYNAAFFANNGYDVIIPDLPGFGDSDKPELDYTLDFFVEVVLEFADKMDLQQFALVGNSLGGAISVGVALAQPERVSHLILMGCGALEDQPYYGQHMEGIQAMTKVPLGSPEFTPTYLKEVLKLIVFDPKHITDELIEERFRVLKTQKPSVFTRMSTPNLTDRLGDIQCPVLGFWGANDRFCPLSGAEKLVTGCNNAQVITLSKCGHWVMIEHPELFNQRSVEFLQNT
ncbi:alpha/beta fold hydrolase [Pseudomaricurvus alkylphenolicus]|uniref:alpha/beta fold hydrolase n=1 Tax=Pseudomaricurvus alkylphenolicus TaxID=1306991 RepID=UPI001423D190|nr:alpha/beta hydrolase [Pseudomaricurvus alkylphenolicus]NIB40331.1 alpha/beta fold hydrolase [Pseudomaricurvus alkylphenolicus]